MAINWQVVNFDWNCARAFLVTLETGSLSAAARALGLTQPTLSRQVATLEAELGVTLFERVGRGLEPTESGLALFEHVRLMGEAANQMSIVANGKSTSIAGYICITCSDFVATFKLPPIVNELRTLYPDIEIDVMATDQVSDLKRREADIAVRYFRPTEPDLIAKKLPTQVSALYATDKYLSRFGSKVTRSSLSDAEFIGFNDMNQNYIDGLRSVGFEVDRSNFKVLCNDQSTHWEMTKSGVGIGIMPIEIGDAERRVRRVLSSKAVFKRPVWLVAHRELKTNRCLKTVFDFLGAKLT